MLKLRTEVAPLCVLRTYPSSLLIAMIRHERIFGRDTTRLMGRPVNRHTTLFLQAYKSIQAFHARFEDSVDRTRGNISAQLRSATRRCLASDRLVTSV